MDPHTAVARAQQTAEDLKVLAHMLGADISRLYECWGCRNYFAPTASDMPVMYRLEEAGFVYKGRPYNEYHFYHATPGGCRIVGLDKAQTLRATGAYSD